MSICDYEIFGGNRNAEELIKEYGSPLFVYDESIIRQRCRELKGLVNKKNFQVNYSCKANNNVALLKIIREEGLMVDAMSPGEIFLEMAAGYSSDEILYICNNVSKDEMLYAIEKNVKVSVDSLNQLSYFGQINPGGSVFVRMNPEIGDGHHDSVVTAGRTKFGIAIQDIDKIHLIAKQYDLTIVGVNMHIGSLFLEPDNYLNAIIKLLEIAENFPKLKYVDFGGGIGIPYNKNNENRFSIDDFAKQLEKILNEWEIKNNKFDVIFILEPGRYIVAESCKILTTVHSIKNNYGTKYIGTDVGFNLLLRPELYKPSAYHEIVVANAENRELEVVSVCGNICESGDFLAKDRMLPKTELGDTLIILDCGAYGFSMSSNYNARLRPAEILIEQSGSIKVIREKETFEYLLNNQIF